VSHFTVDPQSLEALAGRLSGVESQMSRIGDVAAEVSPTQLGSADVFNALQDFHNDWSQGLDKISGNIGGVRARLSAAAQHYGETESGIVRAASPGGGAR
jgi:hypothetical protein